MLLLFASMAMSLATQAQNQLDFQLANYRGNKSCAISYTFDDGLLEHFTLVFPKFQELGFRGTFWINGNTINEGEAGLQQDKQRVSWTQLKKMAEAGQEISNHGWSHKNLTRCTPEELTIEIERNDSIIESRLGYKPLTYCYAFNAKSEAIVAQAQQGRVGTRTFQQSMGHKSTDENLKQRLNNLLQSGEWDVVMIHGITHGYDAFTDAGILWRHLDAVKQVEDHVWVGTFAEVSAYREQLKNLSLQTKRKGKWLQITPQTTLNPELFNQPMTMVLRKCRAEKLRVKQDGKSLACRQQNVDALFDFDPNGGPIRLKDVKKD